MKMLFYVANRMRLIFAVYIVSLVMAASLFSHFEGKTFWDGLWWSVITALTIGYGDHFPVTVPGRMVGIIFGHFWIFGIIPMIIGNVVSNMLEDKNKFTHAEQEWQERMLKAIAVKLNMTPEEAPPDV